ncbi:hypothetical protein HN698_07485, partial [Candidatus Woesearchaeota archaeon]|nr:hypothetical protein [Candidatus Woesearchaeota archaeon]
GIGTTSPGYLLDVNGTSMHRNIAYFSASSVNFWDASGNIRNSGNLYTAGNVGIGTTSPQNKLNVVGDGNFTTGMILGSPSNSVNLTMYSPDGTAYSCGVQNGGAWSCV